MKLKINKRNLKYGSIATAFSAIFIAIIVVINIVGTMLSDRFPLKIDLTSNKVYKLQSQSKKILTKLNQDVTVTVLLSGKSYSGIISPIISSQVYGQSTTIFGADTAEKQIDQVLKQFPLNSSKVKVNYLDLNTNPKLQDDYPNELAYGRIIVKSKLRSKVIAVEDLVNVDTSQMQQGGAATIPSQKAEDAITSAIFYVTSPNIDQVVFTEGHQEATTVIGFQNLLKTNAFVVSSQDIATTKIDATTKYIAIIGPQKDFTDAEIKTLNDFLNNGEQYGKNVMIFFSSSAPSLPKLEEFAKSWGISVGNGVVYDNTNSIAQWGPYFITATLSDSDIYKDLISQNLKTIVPGSRPLDVAFTTKDSRTTSILVQSNSTAQLFIPSTTDTSKKPTDQDPKNIYTVMAMCKNQRYDADNKQLTSAVIVGGSEEFLDDYYSLMSTSSASNAGVMIKAMNSLTGATTSLDILPVSVMPNTFTPTSTQSSIFFLLFVAVIPIAIFIFGIIVWSRRKKL